MGVAAAESNVKMDARKLPMLDDEFHRAKLNGVVSAADGGIVHPVQQIQKKFAHDRALEGERVQELQRVYGRDFAMRLRVEAAVAKERGRTRLPPLSRSHVLEETLLGLDETIEFSDYLGVPELSEEVNTDVRSMMESYLNM